MDLKTRVIEILRTVDDLENHGKKEIRARVAESLGVDVDDKFKESFEGVLPEALAEVRSVKEGEDGGDSSEDEPVLPVSGGKSKGTSIPILNKAIEKGASSAGGTIELKRDTDGGLYAELGNLRRAKVSTFKGSTFIDVREYYTDPSGQVRPGKKGISLKADQWEALIGASGALKAALDTVKK